ncbi:MAG: 2-oxo acid dehydrogenase subunit E2 [Actinomycetota bacterium]|nr:MAG: 2-oxo acid dehydrogenase subunit E2 [Actinomycetota bacterium]
MTTFLLPDVGEGLPDAEIVAWHVGVGDHVVEDQPLVSIETNKAVVEIPSPQSGHIAALHGEPGDVIMVGHPLVEFTDGATPDAGSVVGHVPEEEPPRQPTPPRPAPAIAAAARATPAVRRLAAELGVDLAALAPSGPDASVTTDDVRAAAAAVQPAPSEVEPVRGVRRAMAVNMATAHAQVVPATITEDADVGDWPSGTDATLRLVRAIGVACAAEPALNAAYLGPEAGRRLQRQVHLGVAMDTEDGLFVPVLRDVAGREPDDLRRGLEAMKDDVRARTVPPGDLRGQTITLSNFGIFTGRYAALVVVPPQVAIIGAGRVRDEVVAHHGRPAVRAVLPLSLTFDHRVVMGGEAARFLAALIADLGAPT